MKNKTNPPLTEKEKKLLLNAPMNAFSALFPNHSRAFLIAEKGKLKKTIPVEERVLIDMASKSAHNDLKDTKQKYDFAMAEVKRLEKEKNALITLQKNYQTYSIAPLESNGNSEATAVVLLSDWHIDEVVKSSQVNYLNRFDFELADKRTTALFQYIHRMLSIFQKDISIPNLVLALLGDFISGTIHDDLKESNSMLPIEAIWKVQNQIASGIKYLLDNTNVNLIIPCCAGNHGRITEKQRVSTEFGNSLEILMYQNLAFYFQDNERVKFIVNDSYHTYLDVYNFTLRFHHGHAIKYGGGIGGIFISAYKAISQWNKGKKADLDCFGHFHQSKDGGNFICNGSLIGYNAYAVKIKADFEKPKQTFFLIDKKRGKTITAPIILNGD